MTAAEKEYGGALYDLAVEEKCEDQVLEGLRLVQRLLAENPQYKKLLEQPAIRKEERLALLDQALSGNVQQYVVSFLKILCERRALSSLDGCVAEFCSRLYEARGILPVVAFSAVPLTEQQAEALRQKLAKTTGKNILLENKVDKSLVGGVKVEYEGKELDGSVAGRFEALRHLLLESW
ncbi:ATP synthase F1 subunit delta [uncultured Ruthenibacterium sp.]|uniref:ATP synthase F1 subunit delta n=1 Tax=uncultured Ruthenibacterium sp. TaxID=1905347 RepID=UPI00349E6232